MGAVMSGGVSAPPGLNWIPGIASNRARSRDCHRGRAYNDLQRDHQLLGRGVDVNSAVEFTAAGAQARGSNDVIVFDWHSAA